MPDVKHPIKAYRTRQKPPLTLGKLAEEIGVQPNTVWRWEKGRLPERKHWSRIAEVTGIRPEDLVRFASEAA